MPVTKAVKAAVIAAHGGDASAMEVAHVHGLTHNQVIGIWNRRPRGAPEDVAPAAVAAEPEAAAAVPAGLRVKAAAAWRAVAAAGPAGATTEDLLGALYPVGDRPASWKTCVAQIRAEIARAAGPAGLALEPVPDAQPPRWRLVRASEAAPPEAAGLWTPATARFGGHAGAAWAALLAAGDAGATREAMLAGMDLGGRQPSTHGSAFSVALMRLRDAIKPHGYAIALVEGAKPTRWRIRTRQDAAETATAEAAAPPTPPALVPEAPVAAVAAVEAGTTQPVPHRVAASAPLGPSAKPASPAPTSGLAPHPHQVALPGRAPAPIAGLTGAALAIHRVARGCCRWPIGEPNADDFRFCGEVIEKPVIVGSTGLERPNSYCEVHRERAKGGRPHAPLRLGKTSAVGFGVAQPLSGRIGAGRAA